MAQLMVVPIHDKGDAVLVVSLYDDEPLIGYVTKATLEDHFQYDLTNCDAVRLVKFNLHSFEIMLAAKCKTSKRAHGRIECIEMTLSDMRAAAAFRLGDFCNLRE